MPTPTRPASLPDRDAMSVEHQAWMDACRKLAEAAGVTDVNGPNWNPAIDALRYWGETLHHLRLADPSYDAKALAEAKHLAEHGR